MTDFLLAREPDCFWKLTWKEQFYLLWHISTKRVREGYKSYENIPVETGLYSAHHIDDHGDQTDTDISHKTEAMKQELDNKSLHPETYGKEYDPHALGWEYLEHFVAWCKKRNVKVVFMPSTLMWHESYETDQNEKWFYTHIAEEVRKRGWIYMGKPCEYMYDKTYYFNTNFHLTNNARKVRTEQIIKDLSTFNTEQGL
jgi:hypothetical protein